MKRGVLRNICWNAGGMLAAMIAGFVTAPFLVHRLGTTNYGLWVLIGTLSGYFGLMDLGVRGSVGRQIAFRRANKDEAGLRAIVGSALLIQSCVGILVLLATAGAILLFFHLFEVPSNQVVAVRTALALTGLTLTIEFPISVFDATLWGLSRFDLLNAIDVPVVIVRTVLTFLLVSRDYGLAALALIVLGATVVGEGAKAIVVFSLEPGLRPGQLGIDRSAARDLFGWGFWYFIISMTRSISAQIGPAIVGSVLVVELVTPFSVAARLIGYAAGLLVAAADVVTPAATRLHAEKDVSRQRDLLLNGGLHCTSFALVAGALIVLLGGPFISLWVGRDAGPAAALLPILALGALLPISQRASYGIILAMGRHKLLACLGVLELAVAIVLAVVAARTVGLLGVCLAFALPATLNRWIVQMVYGCRVTSVPLARYIVRTMVWPLLTLALPILGLWAWAGHDLPHTWIQLVLEAGAFSAVAVGIMVLANRKVAFRSVTSGPAVESEIARILAGTPPVVLAAAAEQA